MRTIYLPAIERKVTIEQYVKAVQSAIQNPCAEFKHGLTCWWPCKGVEIQAQFLQGVHDRINQGIPYSQRGK
jgi:hypothetical protein